MGDVLHSDDADLHTDLDAVVNETTARRLLEKELRDQAATLAATVKELKAAQAVTNQLLALVSCELRQPLTLIQGYAELLAEEELTGDQSEFLDAITRGSSRLLSLIEDVSVMTPTQSGGTPTQLGEDKLADLISRRAEAAVPFPARTHIALSVDATLHLAPNGGSMRLGQAMGSLVSTAITYTPDGGTFAIASTHPGDPATIIVVDPRIGIPEVEQTQMFDRLFRTSNA